jgi:elongation factor P hydroxylase
LTIGVQPQAAPVVLALAHGHGFAASTSVNLAGNRAVTAALAITTSPDSSG